MQRRTQGRLRPLTRTDREKRRARNERTGRVPTSGASASPRSLATPRMAKPRVVVTERQWRTSPMLRALVGRKVR